MGKRQPSIRLNFLYNSAYQLASVIIPIITTPYLARVLGATGTGEYGFAFSVANYFTLFIKLGLNNYGGREIAFIRNDRKSLSKVFWELYSFQLLLGIVFSFAYFGYSMLVASEPKLALIFSLYVISSAVDITWFFWGMEEFRLTVTRDFIIKVLTTIGIFLFVKRANDTWKYCLLISSGFLVSQLLLWPSLKKHITWVKPSVSGIKRHVLPNLTLFVPIVAISLYKTMDKIMLGAMSTSAEVGFYHNSENVIQVPIILVTSLGTVMQPRMANMISNNTSDTVMESVFSKSIILAVFLSSALGFGIMAVSKEFVPIFYGSGFERCVELFKILLPSCVFLGFANVIRTQYLIPRKKDREYIVSLFSGAIINVILNAVLIPRLQSVGAAIGTLAAEAAVCITQSILMGREKRTDLYVYQTLPYVISGILMFFIWNGISLPIKGIVGALAIKIVLAGLSYMLFLAVLLLIWPRTNGVNVRNNNIFSLLHK